MSSKSMQTLRNNTFCYAPKQEVKIEGLPWYMSSYHQNSLYLCAFKGKNLICYAFLHVLITIFLFLC